MGTEVTNYDEVWARAAAAYAEQHPVPQGGGGQFLSVRGGILKFEDQPMPGNQACVIVLTHILENTFYEGAFDPDNAGAPKCYAFGSRPDQMAPHESMALHPDYFEPQNDECKGCPQNEWGSAAVGAGKACKNRARLALLPAGMFAQKKGSRDFDLHIVEDPKHFATADIAYFKLPPTSVQNWGKYAVQIEAAHRRPPYGVITRLYVEPHEKHQFHVKFEMLGLVPDALLTAIQGRYAEAAASIILSLIHI